MPCLLIVAAGTIFNILLMFALVHRLNLRTCPRPRLTQRHPGSHVRRASRYGRRAR